MSDAVHPWRERRPPAAEQLWRWRPTTLADLPAIRRDLRAKIADHSTAEGPTVPDPDMFVLALDELMSNALRHGRTPIVVDVGRTEDAWLLAVCDQAVEEPPRPAVHRDPAEGGMGLSLVRHDAITEGWYASPAGKHVWALLP